MQEVSEIQSLAISFGGSRSSCLTDSHGATLSVEIPLLLGEGTKPLLDQCRIHESKGFIIGESGNQMAGISCIEVGNSPEEPSYEIYSAIIEIIGQRQIHRMWNYVPGINEESNNLENYRAFNIGRHRAFVSAYGNDYSKRISPASAVGANGTTLAVAFIAGNDVLENVENPEQTPAYSYPLEHGPKSPSFTRGAHGTVESIPTAYLSGTSSIKDHQSVGNNDLTSQYQTTIDNMRLVTESLGYPDAMGNGQAMNREFTFYLRNKRDLNSAIDLFRATTGESGVACTRFLHSDICRRELLLEIEGSFSRT
ncbi:MAG: hypothetical protein GY899_06240 [Verrucomicrobiaceae bacterium]|nr:hypothetical protein [Verrucomicrobiaceae bacterium]